MAGMLVRHKVQDFNKWKSVFDSLADLRTSNGEVSAQVYREAGDPSTVTAMFKWDSLENAQKYAQSPELKAAMEKAGVNGPPHIHFLNEA